MRCSHGFLIVVGFLILSGLAPAQADSALTAAERTKIQGWIAELSAADFDRRESAQRSILEFGARARPLLVAARKSVDLESRLRVDTLLQAFPAELETANVSLEPTRISLQTRGMTVEEIVAVIERQSAARFFRPLALPARVPVELDFDKKPLFQVLDQLAEHTGHRWYLDYASKRIRFGSTVGNQVPLISYHGPLRISLASLTRNASLRFGAGKSESCYLQGQVDVEPGALVIGAWLPPKLVRVEDDQKRSLIPDKEVRGNFTPMANRNTFHFNCSLKAPARDAKKIALFEGRFEVAAPAAFRRVVLDLASARRGTETAIPGLKIKLIADVTQKKERTITFELERRRVFADEAQTREVQYEEIEFLNERGEPVEPTKPRRVTRRNSTEVHVVSLPLSPIATLSVRVLAKIARKAIPFRFENLELP